MDTKKIGQFLRDLRHEHNLTQEELGEKLGATNKTISRWETGTYMPPADILLAMSKLYGVSVNEILSGERFADNVAYQTKAEENIVTTLKTSQKLSRGKKTLIICGSVFLAIVLALLGLYLFFISLFPGHDRTIQFAKGVYEYQGEPFELVGGLFVEGIEFEFKEISKERFKQSNGVDVVKNNANGRMYELTLSIKVSGDDYVRYSLKYYGSIHSFYDFEVIDGTGKPVSIWMIRIFPETDEYNVMRGMTINFALEGANSDDYVTNDISLILRND